MESDSLLQGRNYYRDRSWSNAYEMLSQADQQQELGPDDLESLANCAYMLGREDDYLAILERAQQAYINTEQTAKASRCAFWLGMNLLFRGEVGRGTGWLASAERLIDGAGACAERGYLLIPQAEQLLGSNDCSTCFTVAGEAADIGIQFEDIDLVACARHIQGRALMQRGSISEGITLLDEVMIQVMSGKLSAIMTGLIYCSVIDACQLVFAYGRAQEWTTALSRWCEQQPQMVAFTGRCLVHRAEIMQIYGDWIKAIEEAKRAYEKLADSRSQQVSAAAVYQQGEIYRLRGEFAHSEKAYERASHLGFDPQPGLALLRLAQNDNKAVTSIRRALEATDDKLERAKLLPAYIEIMLHFGELEEARHRSRELKEISHLYKTDILTGMAAHCEGAVELTEGNFSNALILLKDALKLWQRLGIPYQVARSRVLLGVACGKMGDEEGRRMELEAAKLQLQELGAMPDIAAIEAITNNSKSSTSKNLTARELQVLGLVVAGKTNKSIASELDLSQKTVDRHISNIFVKLGVSSRAAATAYAYEHNLL